MPLMLAALIVGGRAGAVDVGQQSVGLVGSACEQDDQCQLGLICEDDGFCDVPVCEKILDWVCGEDGRVYPNACHARAMHAPLMAGSCEPCGEDGLCAGEEVCNPTFLDGGRCVAEP
jgi:hypothetical protein